MPGLSSWYRAGRVMSSAQMQANGAHLAHVFSSEDEMDGWEQQPVQGRQALESTPMNVDLPLPSPGPGLPPPSPGWEDI